MDVYAIFGFLFHISMIFWYIPIDSQPAKTYSYKHTKNVKIHSLLAEICS